MKNKKIISIAIVSIIIIAGIVTTLVLLLNRPKSPTDNIAPDVNIISPFDGNYISSTLLLSINVTDNNNVDNIWYNWNGNNVSYTAPIYISFNAGTHTIFAWANDTAGNIGNDSVTFSISLNFITDWNTVQASRPGQSNDTQIMLPLKSSGTYSFDVNWGDGSSNTITSWNQSEVIHNYSSEGNYTIIINGTINGWCFNDTGDCCKIINITQWGSLQLGNSGGYFAGCENLQNITTNDILNLAGTTNLTKMFHDCYVLNEVKNMNEWDVSKITDMSSMFYECEAFNQSIGDWDVSNVQDMNYMFYDCMVFNQSIGNWDVSNVQDMSHLFDEANNFNQPIGNWDVSNVMDMNSMFNGAWFFNQSIGNWDVSNVNDMNSMFLDSENFNQSIENWNVSKVTDMNSMFGYAFDFNQYIGNWDVSNVTDMSFMFSDATHFNRSIENWDVSKVQDMYRTFSGASLFNQNISSWDVSNVQDMGYMFDSAGIFNQNIGNWNVSKVTNMRYMFQYANNFDQDIGNWNVSSVTDMYNMFSGSLSVPNYNNLLIGWANIANSPAGVQSDVQLVIGSINFSGSSAQSAYDTLTGSPNNWIIFDASHP